MRALAVACLLAALVAACDSLQEHLGECCKQLRAAVAVFVNLVAMFTARLQAVDIQLNCTATVDCCGNSTAPTTAPLGVSVRWTINGQLAASYNTSTSEQSIADLLKYELDSNPFSSTYGHLTILNATLVDAGVYRCVASSGDGSQHSSIQLEIQGMLIMFSGGSRRGVLRKEKAKQQGSGGHCPPDAEGYFQFNTTFVPGFCM